MSETKKYYRLGNQPEEYLLSEEYVGWLPEGFVSWEDFILSLSEDKNGLRQKLPKELVLKSENNRFVTLLPCQTIIIDAFPLNFFSEERAKDWSRFLIVSTLDDTYKKFIIPMH